MTNIYVGFEMFSAEHFITLGVHLILILALFFSRRFFIKYKAADFTLRMILAIIIVGSEIVLRSVFVQKGANYIPHSVLKNLPIPLCGHLLWLSGIALLSNSERLMRRIYPLTLLGATLSMIVVGGIPHFPEFRAFQYFFCHGGFLIASLYFVFTKKINKFGWKDYGWSCLLLFSMGAVMSIFTSLGVRDDYMAIVPIPETQFLYDALGQVGYTFVFIIFAALVMAIYTLITWLCTRKRKDEDANIPEFKDNKNMNLISKYYTKKIRIVTVVASIALACYLLVCQDLTRSVPFAYILMVYMFMIYGLVIFNEILNNYENCKKYSLIDNTNQVL